MTRPRMNPDRQLFGVIGSVADVSALKRHWNAYFEDNGIDAFMDSYPTQKEELPERLSEMFHFDRRGYIVGKPLQEAVIPLLDAVDPSAREEGSVDTVVNDNGVLTGHYLCCNFEQQKQVWEI